MRAGSSGLGRLGLGLVALCLVETVDQRLDDELDRQLVDVLHVLRVSVFQRAFHRIQKRFLDFPEVLPVEAGDLRVRGPDLVKVRQERVHVVQALDTFVEGRHDRFRVLG